MDHRSGRVLIPCSLVVALLLAGCSAPIPREDVPAGWALDVHQPGEWWTQPLIPRSVIGQRCPPRLGWASEPDLTRVTALPPGSDIEYSFLADDYHCQIGWSEPESEMAFHSDDRDSETGLRRICSSSGLPMDGTLSDYQLRGAGAVRDADGRVLAEAETLRIGLVGDTVTSSHPVVDGIAIVDSWVTPEIDIHVDWDQPPPVQGQVLGADGRVLSTCRA